MNPADVVDALLEAPIAPSFTRLGYQMRRRLDHWSPLDSYDLTGRTILVTGATSGLGRSAAGTLAKLGATVVAVGRDRGRLDSLVAASGVIPEVADLADLDQVRALLERIRSDGLPIDTIIHNAGALLHRRTVSPQGIEVTVASQVVAPFLLTRSLVEAPVHDPATGPLRVLTMSSGGMYAAPLEVEHLEMPPEEYDGTRQYALAKRAQVTLNEMWAERTEPSSAVFHAVHPGWADTPGVADALPAFKKVVGPALRTPEEGADTIVWLAADASGLAGSGRFWLDRRPRSIHRLPTTRRSDTPQRRTALWRHVEDLAEAR